MASPQVVIYVAYCVKDQFFVDHCNYADDLESYMKQAFVGVRLKQRWTTLPRSLLEDIGQEQDVLSFVEVADHDGPYQDLDGKILPVPGAHIHVDMFALSNQVEKLTQYIEPEEEPAPGALAVHPHNGSTLAIIYTLPHNGFTSQWNSLIFDDFFQYRTLRYLLRRVITPTRGTVHNFQSPPGQIVLLHGPTGTGKTILCEALVQQMSIRLSSYYPTSKLIRVNATSFFSQFRSDSDNAVARLFSSIEAMINQDQSRFIFVLMDAIEGLARSRKTSTANAEPGDALRATNALVTAVDMLRQYPNVLLLSATNMLDAVDDAFLDRVSLHSVGLPEAPTRYEIFRAALGKLVNDGDVSLEHIAEEDGEEVMLLDDGPAETPRFDTILPPYGALSLAADKSGSAQTLLLHAKECEGLSGRKLAYIPFDAVCRYPEKVVCTLGETLEAMGVEIAGLRQRSSS